MRPLLVISLLLLGHFLFAQNALDTTISKSTLDSLESQLAYYKDILKRNYFQNHIEKHTFNIDSAYSNTKDTFLISNYDKSKTLLRRQIFTINNLGFKTSLNDIYYDTLGKRLYEEQWKINSESEVAVFMQSRKRYHYDSFGRECGMTIEFWNGAGHKVKRINYSIEKSTGEKKWGDRFNLNKYSFWD